MSFDNWYSMYPRKVCRHDAEKAWARLKYDEKLAAIKSLPEHLQFWRIAGTDRNYIPHPATWLNGRRWEDEIEMPDIERRVTAWWTTDAGILEKGRECGISPRPGEEMGQFKARVAASVRRAA